MGWRLFRMTVPMIGGMLSMVTYNFADTAFVGRLGEDQLAAMGFILPVISFVGAVGIGMGMGAASAISRAVGEGDQRRVRRLTTDALILAVCLVAVLDAVGIATIAPLFTMLGAEPHLLGYIREYMTVWYVGAVFLMVPMVGNNAIRAAGDTVVPSLIMVGGAGINILLDPLLIFGLGPFPAMGIGGAAWATVIGRAATMIAALIILHRGKGMLTFARPRARDVWASWRSILHIALPAGGTTLLFPISMAVIVWLVSGFGDPAVAATGAGNRVEAFAMMVIWAVATAMLPFIGQNWGAGNMPRVHQAQKYGSLFSMVWGAACWGVFLLVARPVARVFTHEPDVVERLVLYLQIMPIGYGARGVCILAATAFNGMGRPSLAALVNFVRMICLYVPLAWAGGELFGLAGLFGGVALGNLLAGALAFYLMRRCARTDAARETPPAPDTGGLRVDRPAASADDDDTKESWPPQPPRPGIG